MDYRKHFPKDYLDARTRFRTWTRTIGGEISDSESRSFKVPSKKDDDLTVDDFYAPALKQFDTLLVLTSGVHGIECATGSAIQDLFFDHLWESVPRDRVGVYVVHCFNPYGFKYGRRSTENNVNLNRNFAPGPELFKTPNDDYRKLAKLFSPREPAKESWLSRLKTVSILARAVLQGFSGAKLNQAIGQGQFEFADGLEYGGTAHEPQTAFFIDRLKSFMPKYSDVVLFDLHTGLGEQAQLHVIPGDAKNAMHPELLSKLMKTSEETNLYKMTPTDTEGFYQTIGDINSLIPALASPRQRILALTFEFGTLGTGPVNKIETLDRIRSENDAFHLGFKSDGVAKTLADRFEELFNPSDFHWRTTVLLRAHAVLARVLRRLGP